MGTYNEEKGLTGRVLLTILTALTIFGVGNLAFAGRDGGGGGGEMCLGGHALGWDDPGTTVTLLDFWEAENKLLPFNAKLIVPRSNLPVETQIKNAINKMRGANPDFAKAIWSSYLHIMKPNHLDVRTNMTIEPPTDTLEPFDGPNCKRIGIGSYDDINDKLDVAKTQLARMDNTDQAGFWMHEAIYRVLRLGSGEDNSIEARLIVGHLFSTQPLEPLIKHRLTKSFVCARQMIPGSEVGSAKFLLHTDGNVTTLVPISYIAPGLPGDQGGQYFWIPKQYVIDYKSTPENFSDYSSEFFGRLSSLLMNLGGMITPAELQIQPFGGAFQHLVNDKEVAVPAQLPTSRGPYAIPYRTKYYGVFLRAAAVSTDEWVSHGSTEDQTYEHITPIVSTAGDYSNGIIKIQFDVSQAGGIGDGWNKKNLPTTPTAYPEPDAGNVQQYTVTCRQF